MFKEPRQGAPDFVKGSISIKREEFQAWLSSQTDDWVNLDIKISKNSGKPYCQVNDYKPTGAQAPKELPPLPPPPMEDDLPF